MTDFVSYAPELPAGRLDPEVESAPIPHAVGFFRRLGPFNLRIGQSGHTPFLLAEEKYTHFKNRIRPKVHPSEHSCTWIHLDAERHKTQQMLGLTSFYLERERTTSSML